MNTQDFIIIVGLGNPGKQYQYSRHNIGYQVLDQIARQHGLAISKSRFDGLWGDGYLQKTRIGLLKPTTYMNLSGIAVNKALSFFQADLENIIVIHDDMDIEWGEIRIKQGGGTAGHKGLNSILRELNSTDFIRIRVGISRPGKGADSVEFVLGNFCREEEKLLPDILKKATSACETIITEGIVTAMNLFNRRKPGETDPSAKA